MSGEIAQPVEQRPEKPCVPSSILGFATIILFSKLIVDYSQQYNPEQLFIDLHSPLQNNQGIKHVV